jgi:hypothetical protein
LGEAKSIHKSQGSGELAPVQRRLSLPIPVKTLNLMTMPPLIYDQEDTLKKG